MRHKIMLAAMMCVAVTIRAQQVQWNQSRDGVLPSFRHLTTQEGLADNHVQHIVQLEDGRMAVTTWSGISLFDGSRFVRPRRSPEAKLSLPAHRGAFDVRTDADGRMWAKRWGELWCLDLHSGCYVENFDSLFACLSPQELPRNVVNLFVDERHTLWLLYDDMLCDVAGGRRIALPSLTGRIVAVEERAEGLWMFTDDGRWVVLNPASGKEEKRCAAAVLADVTPYWDMQVMVGTDSCFYWLFSGHQSKVMRIEPSTGRSRQMLAVDALLTTMAIRPGLLLVGSRHGMFAVTDGGTRHHRQFVVRNGTTVDDPDLSTIHFDRRGDLWIGSNGNGLFYGHSCRFAMLTAPTLDALQLPDSLGLLFRRRRNAQYADAAGHPYNDELTDSRGRVWRASVFGLLLNDGDGERLFTTADGLTGDYVQSLAEDGSGRLWMTTNHGISMIDSRMSITNFDASDGLLTTEYYPRSAGRLPDGRLVMEGAGGWTVFHPDSVIKSARALTPLLVGLTVNGTPQMVSDGGVLRLLHHQNSLDLDFSAFTYDHPLQTYYQWRLVHGRDTVWHRADHYATPNLVDAWGVLHLSMLQLSAGDYRVEVRASTDGYSCASAGVTSFAFHINPPWWQTWWAYTLYIGACVAIAAIVLMTYIRRQRERLEWRRQRETLQLRIDNLLLQANLQPCSAAAVQGDTTLGSEGSEAEEPSGEKGEKGEAALSPKDADFVQRVTELIEKHLGGEYSVEQLAADMCMERTGLYKRLTALIDQSPQTFIRTIRLQRAADLLRSTRLSITDIAYSVGFTSASYLVKCFREKYGCTPGEWRDKQACK